MDIVLKRLRIFSGERLHTADTGLQEWSELASSLEYWLTNAAVALASPELARLEVSLNIFVCAPLLFVALFCGIFSFDPALPPAYVTKLGCPISPYP